MPANLTLEFGKKYEEYKSATSPAQKTRLLKELISVAPKHKGTEKLLGRLKKSLSKLESKIEAERKAKKSGGQRGIKKVAPMIALVGPENSGKTTIFKALTGEGKPRRYPNSTQKPETAIAHYKKAKLQIVDTPSFDSSYGHNADVVVVCGGNRSLGKAFKRQRVIFAEDSDSPEKLIKAAWASLGLLRVFTPDGKYPMLSKKGSTVSDVAEKIHKSFVTNFEWAKIKRGRRTIRVGLDFIVKDGDLLILRSRIG
ncbi:MAG: TGS domain-containing protein [Candidatus Altiarchaeota archaeon]|nr:TGS domain-containing protein [Candidatus Altiarchaeota archaeon]